MTFDKCNCKCHSSNNCKHIMACCSICSVCRQRIRMGFLKQHEESCLANRQEMMEKLKQELEIK